MTAADHIATAEKLNSMMWLVGIELACVAVLVGAIMVAAHFMLEKTDEHGRPL